MLRVGLTGGTGAGKSTVAARLADHGAVVIDADALAREVVAPGSEGLAEVVQEFGAGVLAGDGALDRPALAAIVFAEHSHRETLERITHPRIARLTSQILASAPQDAVVVHDVPLLVEKRMGPAYQLVVVVHADGDERVRRLVRKRGMSEEDARARVRAQADDEARVQAADVVLNNSGPPKEVLGAVDELWRERLVPFERNVREHRAAGRDPLVTVREHDPGWGHQAQRLVDRLAFALADEDVVVEHVGSTAVRGLPARDVIDLQVVVNSLQRADELQPLVEATGFAPMPGEWLDDEPNGPAGKRVFGNCDPGRVVNVHVRPRGWTSSHVLLLRDWLRVHPDERSAYGEVKREAQGCPVETYVEAKAPWIRSAYERAEAWAEQSGWEAPVRTSDRP